LEHFISSLLLLFSFDHAKCDAILQARNISVANAYDPAKTNMRDSVYFGFWFVLCWETLVVASAIWAWRRANESRPNIGVQRFGLPIFGLFGVFFLYLQLSAMVKYVETCTSLMH